MTSADCGRGHRFFDRGVIIVLLSAALILFIGITLGGLCAKIHLPPLVGMIAGGILIGPYVLNLLDPNMLLISPDIRKAALIVILIRAGLKLNLSDLKKAGVSGILMCFVPACFEMAGMVLLAPPVLGILRVEAALLGAVTGAVSPAVIVPRMIRLIDEKRGSDKAVPQMILAGASADDVFAIVMFTSFLGIMQGEKISVMDFAGIPISLITGIAVGIVSGYFLALVYKKTRLSPIISVLIILMSGFALSAAESNFGEIVPFASMIAVMCMGIGVKRKAADTAAIMTEKFSSIWIAAEIFLFVLVGSCVSTDSLKNTGVQAVLLVIGALVFRAAGVILSLAFTKLDIKEKLFCIIAYMPKATVQAAIGGIPLAMGLACGDIVLAVSVTAILFTAPLGALGIDMTYKKLLREEVRK